MAVSLGDALGISEVRLPRQSAVAYNFRVRRLGQNVSMYRPDCLFQTVTGFWEVTPVNDVNLRTYRTDHSVGGWNTNSFILSSTSDKTATWSGHVVCLLRPLP